MKIIYTLPLSFILLLTTLSAQKLEVKYQEITHIDEEAVKKDIELNNKTNELSDNFIKNWIKNITNPKDYLLTVNYNQSYYKEIEKISNNQSRGTSFRVIYNGEVKGLFKDLSANEYLKSVYTFDKDYTIKDQLKNYQWKMSRETKKILGFDVKKAISTIDREKIITAWYAPSIPVKNGPAMYNGLPGLILEVQIINSESKIKEEIVIKAFEVKENINLKSIRKPKKNIITDQELKNILETQDNQLKEISSEGVDREN